MYKLVRTDTLWTASEAAPAVTTGKSGHHLWWLTNNSFSSTSTTPPALSIFKIVLDGLYDRAVLEWAGKLTAVGGQTLCTSCKVYGLSALLYKTDTGLAFFDDSLISQLQGSAISPADCANGEAATIQGGAPGTYSIPLICSDNKMTTELAVSAPVIGVAGGRTPLANDVTKFRLPIGNRSIGTATSASTGVTGVNNDISGVQALHFGLKWVPAWTDNTGQSTSVAGKLLLHLFRETSRGIG